MLPPLRKQDRPEAPRRAAYLSPDVMKLCGMHAGEWVLARGGTAARAAPTTPTTAPPTALPTPSTGNPSAQLLPQPSRCACVQLWPLRRLAMHRAVLPAAARVALGVAEGDPLSVSKLSQAPVVADLLVLQPLLLQQGEAGRAAAAMAAAASSRIRSAGSCRGRSSRLARSSRCPTPAATCTSALSQPPPPQ